MMYRYKESDMKELSFTDEISTVKRMVCPKCYDHIQGSVSDVLDCKNEYIYTRGHQHVGQCCCFSEAHGKRRPLKLQGMW